LWAVAGPAANVVAASAVVAARIVNFARRLMVPRLSRPRDGEPFNSHGRRVGGAFELQVVGRRHVEEHVLEVARHRDAAHRPAELAVLDPEARCTATVVAGDAVDAEA